MSGWEVGQEKKPLELVYDPDLLLYYNMDTARTLAYVRVDEGLEYIYCVSNNDRYFVIEQIAHFSYKGMSQLSYWFFGKPKKVVRKLAMTFTNSKEAYSHAVDCGMNPVRHSIFDLNMGEG